MTCYHQRPIVAPDRTAVVWSVGAALAWAAVSLVAILAWVLPEWRQVVEMLVVVPLSAAGMGAVGWWLFVESAESPSPRRDGALAGAMVGIAIHAPVWIGLMFADGSFVGAVVAVIYFVPVSVAVGGWVTAPTAAVVGWFIGWIRTRVGVGESDH